MTNEDDLLAMGDDELQARIMAVLKKKCDDNGFVYPPKLVAYLMRTKRD